MHSGWCFGKCDRTGEEGDFPANCVYVLPAIRRPPKEVLALFQDQSSDGSEAVLNAIDAGREDGEGAVDDKCVAFFCFAWFSGFLCLAPAMFVSSGRGCDNFTVYIALVRCCE